MLRRHVASSLLTTASLLVLLAAIGLDGCAVNPVPTPGGDGAPMAKERDDDGQLAADAGKNTGGAGGSDAGAAEPGGDSGAGADTGAAGPEDAGESTTPLAKVVIAAIADPHITGGNYKGDKMTRLLGSIDWINKYAKPMDIRMVLVLGDVAWSGGLKPCKAALDKLNVPYVPLNGDNVMFAGDEKTFDDVFGPVYAKLQTQFPGMARAATPTYHPGLKQDTILQNLAFDLDGAHIVIADLNPREKIGTFGEQGELHNYKGGTWPWLNDYLGGLKSPRKGSVLIASHIPMAMSPGALKAGDMENVAKLADKHPGLIHASIAGHYHVVTKVQTKEMKFPSMTIPATWAGLVRVHIATATVFKDRVEWAHKLHTVPGFSRPP